MAPTRKSAKRKTARKGSAAKASPSRKQKRSKAPSKSATTRKRAKAARGGLDSVLQVGEKTWKTLKTTTGKVVEGVKDTFGG